MMIINNIMLNSLKCRCAWIGIVYGNGAVITNNLNQYLSDKNSYSLIIEYNGDDTTKRTIYRDNYNFIMESVIKEAVKNKTVAHRYSKCDCSAECYNKRNLFFAGDYAVTQCVECGRIKVVKRAKFKDLAI